MAEKKKVDKKPSIYVMSDEEFSDMKLKEDKDSIIDNLIEASNQKTTKFSVLRKKKEQPKIELSEGDDVDKITRLEELDFSDKETKLLTDTDWDAMMDRFDELSPIDDITYEDRLSYRRKTSDDKFEEMFKKEQSMLNDLLAQLQKRSKTIDKKIELMSGSRATYGVSKNLTELLDVSNSIEVNKLNVIKELVNIKKTSTDLRMKEQRYAPDTSAEEDKDTIADRFYRSIVAGKSKDFIESSMSGYKDEMGIQDYNISQPMRNYPEDEIPEKLEDIGADEYGYIRNEVNNVQVCLCQYDDGTSEFIALDDDNNAVYDYELPSSSLLVDISIKPGAAFAYDKYSRKYPIVDPSNINFNQTNNMMYESIDDLDDYKDVNTDDKYIASRDDDEDDLMEDDIEDIG